MKILFGVQGTGNGHITRAIAITEALKHYDDIHVDMLISGRSPEPMELSVDNLQWRSGLTFITEAGKVKVIETATQNKILQLFRDIKALDLSSYDLIVSDYEPVVSWASKIRHRQLIGIGHQYSFYHTVPRRGDNPFNRFGMKWLAPADVRIGLHWHHFDQPILPPIVDVETNEERQIQHNKVTVYLPFEDQEQVIALLRKCSDYEFYIYSPELTDRDEDHVHRRKTSRVTFKSDLTSSSAVIANSGFELISECLALGIKVFTKPLAGQIEQLSNAAALAELEYATVTDNLFLPSVEKWLKSSRSVQVTYPNVQECLARWLASGARESVDELAEKMWRDVEVTRR